MKHTIRALLGLILVLAMMLSLAACGEKKEEQPGDEPGNQEMVYASSSKLLKDKLLENGVNPVAYMSDGFYGVTYGKIAEGEIPEGVVPEYEGQYDIYGSRILFVGYDGSVRELSGYKPMEGEKDTEGRTEYYSGSSLSRVMVGSNGELILVESTYANWFDGTQAEYDAETYDESYWEKYKYEQNYFIRKVDAEGNELSSAKIDFNMEDTWLDFERSVLDDEDNILVIGNQTLYAFSQEGSLLFQIEGDFWPYSVIKLKDGTIGVTGYGEQNLELHPLDFQKKSYGKGVAIPSDAYSVLPGGGIYDFCYINGMYFYGYDMESKEQTKILNWLDVDINSNNLRDAGMKTNANCPCALMPDGTIYCVLTTWKESGTQVELATVSKVPADSVPKKETLTLAALYAGELYDKVVEFNRHSDSVRIQILDYSEYNDYEHDDYDAGRTKLLTEMLSGNMPDIISLNQLPYKQLAAKGLLEDLYPYLDSDPELNRGDLFPNVLQALEVNGKLCQITPSFDVQTLIGSTSVVGDKPGWTYQDLQEALAKMPEGCSPLDQYTVRESLLRTLLSADMDSFVDWTTGKCNFESEDFIEMLEFVAMFPETIPDDVEWESTSNLIAQGRQMLTSCYLYSIDSMLWNDLQFGKQGCTYIGYPTNNGVGSVLYLDSGYGMSSTCRNKDAAWQFLRTYLLEETQANVWGLPVSVKEYQKKLDYATTIQYQKDEKGNYLLDAETGEKIPIPYTWYWNDETGEDIPVYCITQEQADKLWQAIITCTKVADSDESVFKIVYDQAQAYFSGQKSAQDVAKLIQSKVTIYVNEQR